MDVIITESGFSGTKFRASKGGKWLVHDNPQLGTEHDLKEMMLHYWGPSTAYLYSDTFVYYLKGDDNIYVSFLCRKSMRETHRLTVACNRIDRDRLVDMIMSW